MKMNPLAWFRPFRTLTKVPECAAFSSSDTTGENTPPHDLFSTPQLERYGQKLAHTHKLSPEMRRWWAVSPTPAKPDVVVTEV